MGVSQGGKMSANVVEVSYNLAIMSIVMQSSSMPLEELAGLKGKVFTWYLDNVPPTRDPQTRQETPQIRELLQKTEASFVVQVLFQQIHAYIHCLDTHDSHIHTLSCTRKHHVHMILLNAYQHCVLTFMCTGHFSHFCSCLREGGHEQLLHEGVQEEGQAQLITGAYDVDLPLVAEIS